MNRGLHFLFPSFHSSTRASGKQGRAASAGSSINGRDAEVGAVAVFSFAGKMLLSHVQ
jgi:hypothetical protein